VLVGWLRLEVLLRQMGLRLLRLWLLRLWLLGRRLDLLPWLGLLDLLAWLGLPGPQIGLRLIGRLRLVLRLDRLLASGIGLLDVLRWKGQLLRGKGHRGLRRCCLWDRC
jgi:hypothetical protein